jgi:hypothetical protein
MVVVMVVNGDDELVPPISYRLEAPLEVHFEGVHGALHHAKAGVVSPLYLIYDLGGGGEKEEGEGGM